MEHNQSGMLPECKCKSFDLIPAGMRHHEQISGLTYGEGLRVVSLFIHVQELGNERSSAGSVLQDSVISAESHRKLKSRTLPEGVWKEGHAVQEVESGAGRVDVLVSLRVQATPQEF